MTPHDFEGAAQYALLEREIARVSAGLARQVEEAMSFRDAVARAVTWLLDDAEAQGAPRVPAARAGGSESLLVRASTPGSVDPLAALSQALEEALHLRSPGGDPVATARVSELILHMSRSWLSEPQSQPRQDFIDDAVEVAVASAVPQHTLMTAAPKA